MDNDPKTEAERKAAADKVAATPVAPVEAGARQEAADAARKTEGERR